MFQQPLPNFFLRLEPHLPNFFLTLEPLYLSDDQRLFPQGDIRFPLVYSPSDMEAESGDEATLTDEKMKKIRGSSKKVAMRTPAARTRKPTREEKKFERRVGIKPRARMQWKKKEIVEEVEAIKRLGLKRKNLASFESRFFYHYELPTICKLVHSKCPEMFAPPQLSATPPYEYVRNS